jgi:hypothetical protein
MNDRPPAWVTKVAQRSCIIQLVIVGTLFFVLAVLPVFCVLATVIGLLIVPAPVQYGS